MLRPLCCLGLSVVATGCGKYLPPLPPEALAPKEVESLDVQAAPGSVNFSWDASDKDRRGKELQSIDGYTVQRKEIAKRGDETNPEIEFTDVAFVKDTHIEVREELRKEAREQGKIGRSVKLPEDLTHFTFSDTSVKNGKTYIYQVLPINQGDVEGVVTQVVKVVYKGADSDVIFLAAKDIEATEESGAAGGGAAGPQ
jgi:hypothetical protein